MTKRSLFFFALAIAAGACGDDDTDTDGTDDPTRDLGGDPERDLGSDPPSDLGRPDLGDPPDATVPPGEPLAFPGAMGFGAGSIGGRGGAVLHVTNLDASGEGSLAWAVAQPGPRIVVFDVSGVIEGDVNIPHGELTIAGQTAPCGGITLNGSLTTTYQEPMANIIVRHLRISPPSPDPADCATHDAIQFSAASHVILDHVDASHAGDEIIDFWGGAHDITVQWSSIVFPIAGGSGACDHPKGLINHRPCADSGSCDDGDALGGRISVHHNLFAHCQNRTPALSTGPADVINNVTYNGREGFVHHNVVGAHSTDMSAIGEFNIVGNSYIEGPSTSLAPLWFDPENGTATIPTRYYVRDNWVEDDAFSGGFDDPWTNADFSDAYTFACCGVEASQFQDTPFDFTAVSLGYVPITTESPTAAYAAVIARAGAWPRDIITRTAVSEVEARTGEQRDFVPGDFMEGLTTCAPPADGDGDGMPDDWESANGLDPSTADDDTVTASGYTAIEDYLNERADAIVAP